MSKKPSQQKAAARRDAKNDRSFWRREMTKDKNAGTLTPTSRATYQRAIDRANKEIRDNS